MSKMLRWLGRFCLILIHAATLATVAPQRATAQPESLTLREAQTLPVDELAHRILGAAGSLVYDLDRPDWGPCPILVGRCRLKWPPDAPPPLDQLVFYGRAFATGFKGLCRSNLIVVELGDSGSITNLSSVTRYGMESTIQTVRKQKSAEVCANSNDVRFYFEAVDALSAFNGIRFVSEIMRASSLNTKVPYKIKCTFSRGPRCVNTRSILQELDVREIAKFEAVDCATEIPNFPDCYKITFQHSGDDGGTRQIELIARGYATQDSVQILSVDLDEEIFVY
jgi:hypothetical protein